jgi:hypothetical protein
MGSMVNGAWQPNWLGNVLDVPHTLFGGLGMTPMLSHLGALGLLDIGGSTLRHFFSPRYLRAGRAQPSSIDTPVAQPFVGVTQRLRPAA